MYLVHRIVVQIYRVHCAIQGVKRLVNPDQTVRILSMIKVFTMKYNQSCGQCE